MRTSFHHQPEAQHPIFQLSTSWQADYPIFRSEADITLGKPKCYPSPPGAVDLLQPQTCSERLGVLVGEVHLVRESLATYLSESIVGGPRCGNGRGKGVRGKGFYAQGL
jgi:hypothetical protein